jgi:D-amino peptidase
MNTPLRVLISADLEGISGIVHPTETTPGLYDYERGRELMTAEVNAVIAGVLDAVGAAEIRVVDAHGPFRNLLPERLHRQARLVRGRPRPLGMMAGLDDDTDAVLFVGYHGRAGSGPAVLAHTMSPALLDVRLDGQSLGEIGLNTILAGHHRVPVIFLSGDDTAGRELGQLVPEAVTVAVKRALGQASAETLHPAEARDQLTRAAAVAIQQRDRVQPLTCTGPVQLAVDLYRPHIVDLAVLIPGVARAEGARTVTFTGRDVAEAYRVLQLLVELGQLEAS